MSLAKYLSKKDAIDLLEINYKAMLSTDENEFKRNVLQLQNLIPFEYALCGYGNLVEGSIKNINIKNCEGYINRFFSRKLYLTDPVLIELFETYEIQYWKTIHAKYPVKDIISLEFEEFGTNNDLTFGVTNFNRDMGAVFSFAGKHIRNEDRTRAIILNTVPHLSVGFTQLVEAKKEATAFNAKLTNREIEVLKWIKEGKSSFEVSVILNISERTVNFHCNNFLRKLDAVNRVQAVAVALKEKIIDW